ncbi:MAG: hypothetical protein ACTS8Y_05110 [Arsenophonus sp. ER-EMS1-MAG3]
MTTEKHILTPENEVIEPRKNFGPPENFWKRVGPGQKLPKCVLKGTNIYYCSKIG